MALSTKLKELRIKFGQSLQQVADGVGVSKAHIWELEKGSSKNPGIELLGRLADHFKVTVSYLTDESAEPQEASALRFFREFEGKLSERDWDTLHTVADRLKDTKE